MKTFTTKGNFGRFYFVDEKGKASRPYYFASDYKYGFAKVQETQLSKPQYIDLLGRTSDLPTASGSAFYHFCMKQSSLQCINILFFADKAFCQGIKEEIILQEKKRVTELYKTGQSISKATVEKRIQDKFAYIANAHVQALNIILEQQKQDATAKQKEQAKKEQQLAKIKAKQDEFSDIINYLDTL